MTPRLWGAGEPMTAEIHIDAMQLADVDGVTEIERQAFITPWSRDSFVRELTENIYAHYMVARAGQRVVGYAGMWVVLDEAHVTNVAVHPDWRGRKVGERLMAALMEQARRLGATRMTLEVRASNHVAQSLYRKLGFRSSGIRPGYYTDTREDAVIMWLDPIPAP